MDICHDVQSFFILGIIELVLIPATLFYCQIFLLLLLLVNIIQLCLAILFLKLLLKFLLSV